MPTSSLRRIIGRIKMAWNDLPMVVCPHCDEEFQVDDYYNLGAGDSFYCDECEKEIFIYGVEIILSADLHRQPEDSADLPDCTCKWGATTSDLTCPVHGPK